MVKMNSDLKREYEAQLCLFSALRGKYAERELARNVVDELKKEVSEEAGADSPGTSNGAQTAPAPEEADKPPENQENPSQ